MSGGSGIPLEGSIKVLEILGLGFRALGSLGLGLGV